MRKKKKPHLNRILLLYVFSNQSRFRVEEENNTILLRCMNKLDIFIRQTTESNFIGKTEDVVTFTVVAGDFQPFQQGSNTVFATGLPC